VPGSRRIEPHDGKPPYDSTSENPRHSCSRSPGIRRLRRPHPLGNPIVRIAIVGARGQLGSDLCSLLGDDAVPLSHADIEITNTVQVAAVLSRAAPEAVINTAAWNKVDLAEDQPAAAFSANAVGPRNLAQGCEHQGIRLIHISTDYVFGVNGERTEPYRETDCPGPVSTYGSSKLAGEHLVAANCSRHVIVRTCGLYGTAGVHGGGNFVETMLRLSRDRSELKVVCDQRCTPTSSADLATALVRLTESDATGIVHATSSGALTWYDLACEIMSQAGRDTAITPITSEEFGARAHRPAYSVLDNSRLHEITGMQLPAWQVALERYLVSRRPVAGD